MSTRRAGAPSAATPRRAEKYLRYNAHPDKVGTRSGIAMPENVAIDDEGFEDPDEFFRSDSEADSGHETEYTDYETPRPPRLGGASGDLTAPNTAKSQGQGRTARARSERRSVPMSDLLAEAEEEDVLFDLDDVNLDITPPSGPAHPSSPNPPASVPQLRSSQVLPPSPVESPNFGITSPLSSKNKGKGKKDKGKGKAFDSPLLPPAEFDVSPSRVRSPLSTKNMNKRYHSTFDDMMDDDSERSFSPTGHLGPAASSPRVRSPAIVKAKQKAKKVRSPEPESEPESEPEFEPDAQPEFEPDFEPDFEPEFEPDFEPERDPSLEPDDVDSQPIRRLGSKKTVAPIEDDDGRVPDTYDEDDVEVSVIVGNETLMDETFNMDAEGSESDESVSDNEPDYVDEDEEEEEEEEDSDNGGDGDETIPYADDYDEEDVIYPHDVTEGESFYAGLDESANLEEEAIWAENASGSDSDPDRTPRAAPGKRPRDEPVARSPGGRPIIRRTRKSEVGVDPENGYQGDFKTRRSGRMHIRPLEYWRNETVRYKPAHLLPAIAEVVRPAAPEPRSRPKRAPRPKPQIVRPPTPDSDDEVEVGIDDNVNQRAVVHEYGKNMMRSRRVVVPKSKLNPRLVENESFMYEKVFGEQRFLATGILDLPPGASKPPKSSQDNAYVFYVITGTVQVQLHQTKFLCSTGGQFLVPRGNMYSITNTRHRDAKLFFAQARKLKSDEQSDADVTADEDDDDDDDDLSGGGDDGDALGSFEDAVRPTKKRRSGVALYD